MCCDDLKFILEGHPNLFSWDDSYGFLISWIELVEEKGYTKSHKYGIPISHCPFCGELLGEHHDV